MVSSIFITSGKCIAPALPCVSRLTATVGDPLCRHRQSFSIAMHAAWISRSDPFVTAVNRPNADAPSVKDRLPRTGSVLSKGLKSVGILAVSFSSRNVAVQCSSAFSHEMLFNYSFLSLPLPSRVYRFASAKFACLCSQHVVVWRCCRPDEFVPTIAVLSQN